MRVGLAYQRHGGERGFTPGEFRGTAEEVAGVDLKAWFGRALAFTGELDYAEALDWLGPRFATDGIWTLEILDQALASQTDQLQALVASATNPSSLH